LVQATFRFDYSVSQIPHSQLPGVSKELIGAAKVGVNPLWAKVLGMFFYS